MAAVRRFTKLNMGFQNCSIKSFCLSINMLVKKSSNVVFLFFSHLKADKILFFFYDKYNCQVISILWN